MEEPIIQFSETSPAASNKKVYTVSQLNSGIRGILESYFVGIWMEGEISNFKRHTSGHIYLSLKDDKSQMNAVFFAGYNQRVRFEMKDGLKVLVYGKVSVYEPRGNYQFYIERIEPKGIGGLQLAFNQLRMKLEKEGLFDSAHKKNIPKFPKTVAVVTSPTGAAIRDILNVMGRRSSGTEVLVYPVLVQGEGSAAQIAKAIADLNQLGGVDVMIVGRGGGSIEDLWAFNEEVVARAIYQSSIPVISAVGHEIDWTIADFVADLRAPTPSAAAELVVENRADLERRVRETRDRMRLAILDYIGQRHQNLEALEQSYAFKQPKVIIDQLTQRFDESLRHMQNYARNLLSHKMHELQNAAGRLNALSPLAILERGYSISLDENGKLVKDIAKIKKGDIIKTRLHQGGFVSEVIETEALSERRD